MLKHQPNLITGTEQDPLLPKLVEAIRKASHIEIAVSFVQPSGLNLLFSDLVEALGRGAELYFLTSDYLNITHPVALRSLLLLVDRGAKVKVFECNNSTSFHLKTYIFTQIENNNTTAGCAFIGSNNINKAALTHSYEWAWRHDWSAPYDSDDAKSFLDIRQAFNELFCLPNTQWLSNEWLTAYQERYTAKTPQQYNVAGLESETVEVSAPYPVQMEALNALQQTRLSGFKRGLVVLATGMGKTWLAAFDSKQFNA